MLQNSHDCVRMNLFAPTEMRTILARSIVGTTDGTLKGQSALDSLLTVAHAAAESGAGRGRYWDELPQFLHVRDHSANSSSRTHNLADILVKRQGLLRRTLQERARKIERLAIDRSTLALHTCIRASGSPAFPPLLLDINGRNVTIGALDPDSEEAVLFLQLAWDTDRLGALLLLRAAATAQLTAYPTRFEDDLEALLGDAAARVVLSLSAEEDVAGEVEALLDYALPVLNLLGDAVTYPSFETWRSLLLTMLREPGTVGAPQFPLAQAQLLPPRKRSSLQFLVTEKAQLVVLSRGGEFRATGKGGDNQSSPAHPRRVEESAYVVTGPASLCAGEAAAQQAFAAVSRARKAKLAASEAKLPALKALEAALGPSGGSRFCSEYLS